MERQPLQKQEYLLEQDDKPQKGQNNTRISLQSKTINQKYHVFEQLLQSNDYSYYLGMETNRRHTRKLLVKLYDFQSIEKSQGFQQKQMKKRGARLQQKLLQSIKSRHFPKYYDICEINRCKAMIFEYHSIQTLSQKVQKKVFSEHQAILTLKQIIKAVHELRQKNCINISLTPDSIICDVGTYKLIQFGYQYFIQQIMQQQKYKNKSVKPVNYYIAPQIHERRNFSPLKAQVWMFGMIYFFMLFGKVPYDGEIENLKKKDWMLDFFPKKQILASVSGQTLQFVRKTLEIDPTKRMKFQEMLHHQMFKQHQNSIPQRIVLDIDISNLKIEHSLVENKCNIEKLKEQLQQQLQEPYQLSNSDLFISSMQRGDITTLSPKFQKIKKSLILHKINNEYLDCLKANWIYESIYEPLASKNILNQSERQIIQFKYLILTRCLCNISNIQKNLTIIIEEAKKDNQNQQCMQDYSNQIIINIRKLDNKIKMKWKTCSNQLSLKQTQKSQIFIDRFKSFISSKQQKQKDKILAGVQIADYTKQQQISYTIKYFWSKISQMLKKACKKSSLDHQIIKKAKQILKHMEFYYQINSISFNQSNQELTFSQIVKNIQTKSQALKQQISANKQQQHYQELG